jgi:hypothetical protein
MAASINTFTPTTTIKKYGTKSVYRAFSSRKLNIINFITGPYTITFWVFTTFPGNWGGQKKTILVATSPSTSKFRWRFGFNANGYISIDTYEADIGYFASDPGPTYTTNIQYTDFNNRWVLISISSSGRVKINGTTTNYDSVLFGSIDIGDYTLQFSGRNDVTSEDIIDNMYFDDIRIYNADLSTSELNAIYNENLP